MSLTDNLRRTNTIAVVVDNGTTQVFANGLRVNPGGGPDNNPTATIIDRIGHPLVQAEQLEDAAVKQSFQSAFVDQICHVMLVNTTVMKGSSTHKFPPCEQMEQKIIELENQAAKMTNPLQRSIAEDLITSDKAIVDAICHKRGQVP